LAAVLLHELIPLSGSACRSFLVQANAALVQKIDFTATSLVLLNKKNVKTFWVYAQYFFWARIIAICINIFDGKSLIACNLLNNNKN